VRAIERRQDEIVADLTREAQPEQLIELHPNLPELYRRRVEALEAALQEPEAAAAAGQAWRSLINAVIFYRENGCGKYRLESRGDFAGFLSKLKGHEKTFITRWHRSIHLSLGYVRFFSIFNLKADWQLSVRTRT
jgi:hypothetical protein